MSPKGWKDLRRVPYCGDTVRNVEWAWYNVLGGSDCFNFSTFSESFKTRV